MLLTYGEALGNWRVTCSLHPLTGNKLLEKTSLLVKRSEMKVILVPGTLACLKGKLFSLSVLKGQTVGAWVDLRIN